MDNVYFLFHKEKTEINNENLKIIQKIKLKLTTQRYKRLFLKNEIPKSIELNDYYNVSIVKCEKNFNTITAIDNEKYYRDCNKEMYDFLKCNTNIIGSSSNYQNNIIKALLFGSEKIDSTVKEIKKLYGENNWNSLEEYFKILYISKIKYVSLRKNEFLPFSFIENDKDIDILCANKDEFKLLSNGTKRSVGISGYKIKIKNEWVSLDIRYKGDYYFDPAWEENILANCYYNLNNISVIDRENQLFSILYHILTQKKEISSYYLNYLEKEISNTDLKYITNLLIKFMKKNNYTYHIPADKSVIQNRKIIKIIKKEIILLTTKQKCLYCIFNKFPKRIIPKRIKKIIYENDD